MEKSQMTLEQFVKDNLSDYDRRLTYFFGGDDDNPVTITQLGVRAFTKEKFAEALENFRQSVWRQACEEMRSQCQDALDWVYEYDTDDDGRLWQFEKLYRQDAIESILIPEPPKNE